MKKIKKIILLLSIIATVGITYAITVFKNIPETFDWSLEEDIDDE